MSRIPLIVILGATGTGKTKLSIELAKKFNAEIINSDSMQVYKGLDLITAKATAEEREMAPHHLVDILEPHQTYSVVDFRKKALEIIDNLLSRNISPIIVGGTNYYMESILWRILVEDREDDDTDMLVSEKDQLEKKKKLNSINDTDELHESNKKIKISNDDSVDVSGQNIPSTSAANQEEDFSNESTLSNEYLYHKLKQVDPPMAERLHPNNRRKILRAIQIWQRTGKRHSDILLEQKEEENKLRYSDNTIVLWLVCDQKIHDIRLDNRIDDMIKQGLLKEMTLFHEKYNKHRIKEGNPVDYTKGVFQTIGFKEFHSYMIISDEEKKTEAGQKLFREGLDNLKMATRRYSRKQKKTILSRILNHPTRQIPPIFDLDATDFTAWDLNIKERATKIIESFMRNEPFPFEPLKSKISEIHKLNKNVTRKCGICDRIFIGDLQFNMHMNSYRHLRVIKRLDREKKEADAAALAAEVELNSGNSI